MPKIIIYTTQNCGYCVRAKSLLSSKGAVFEELRVDLSSELRQEMLDKSNGKRTVPQIFIDDTHVGGFDELWQLEQNGQLDALLKNA